jgi:hypothetical protein
MSLEITSNATGQRSFTLLDDPALNNLDYRTWTYDEGKLYWALYLPPIILITTFVIRYFSSSNGILYRIAAIALLIVAFLVAYKCYKVADEDSGIEFYLGGIIVLVACLLWDNKSVFFILYPMALFYLLQFAHETMIHFSYWMQANPFLRQETRLEWANIWVKPIFVVNYFFYAFPNFRRIEKSVLDLNGEEKQLNEYRTTLFLFLSTGAVLLFFLSTLNVIGYVHFPGFLAVSASFVVLLLYFGTQILSSDTSERFNISAIREIVKESIRQWFFYNYHETNAPGVFKSPAGDVRTRHWKAYIAYTSWITAVLITCSYFPISLFIVDVKDWINPLANDGTFTGYKTLNSLAEFPEIWPLIALKGLTQGSSQYVPFIALTFLMCLIIPPCLFVFYLTFLTSRVLLYHKNNMEVEAAPYKRKEPLEEWGAYIQRFIDARTQGKSERVLIGISAEGEYPVSITREQTNSHVHIVGGTDAGKTSGVIFPLAKQLIGRNSSLVIVDLKGDIALFQTAREYAENVRDNEGRPIPFQVFTNYSCRATHVFNPFSQTFIKDLDPTLRAEYLAQATRLIYEGEYGRVYFSQDNFQKAVRFFEHHRAPMTSFKEMKDKFHDLHKHIFQSKQRAYESAVYTVLENLSGIEPLNFLPTSNSEPALQKYAIEMKNVVQKPHIVYFYIDNRHEVTGRTIANICCYAIKFAVQEIGSTNHQTYLVVDELQRLVSDSFVNLFEQIRDKNVSVVAAHQSRSQLNKGTDAMFADRVFEDTRLKFLFAPMSPDERKYYSRFCGDIRTRIVAHDNNGVMDSNTFLSLQTKNDRYSRIRERIKRKRFSEKLKPLSKYRKVDIERGPRYTSNDFIDMTAYNQCLFCATKKSSVKTPSVNIPPQIINIDHLTRKNQYDKKQKSGWISVTDYPGLAEFVATQQPEKTSTIAKDLKSNEVETRLNSLSFDGAQSTNSAG